MSLEPDCFLAYTIVAETYYADVAGKPNPTLWISASCRDGGVDWQFDIEEVVLSGRPCTRLVIFDDGYKAFTQIPELFASLADTQPATIAATVDVLKRHGAVDITERTLPLSGRRSSRE